MVKRRYVVSSCLLGHNCKYSGGNNRNEKLINFLKDQEVLCVCPEVLGGLPIPRASSEIRGDKVINTNGEDVSKQFYAGALKALQKTLEFQPDLAILQPRSPSCGKGFVYDGTFTKRLVPGNGVFVKMLLEAGIEVKTCEEFSKELDRHEQNA